jgi:hypothetical protein
LYPRSATNGKVYWGKSNGSVSLFHGPHDSAYRSQAPGAGVNITSMSVAGNYILWGERTLGEYEVEEYDNGNVVSVAASGSRVDVQGDAGLGTGAIPTWRSSLSKGPSVGPAHN